MTPNILQSILAMWLCLVSVTSLSYPFNDMSSVTASAIASLNSSINGHLYRTVPLAAPCFTQFSFVGGLMDSEQCNTTKSSYTDGDYRAERYGSAQYFNWETCGSEGCALTQVDGVTDDTGNRTCVLGRLSEYYVDASDGHDIAQAFVFAKKYRIRTSILNKGHDYLGRSTAKGSLAIWTHNLKDIAVIPSYTPASCDANASLHGQNVSAIRLGAGTTASEAYLAASDSGYQAIGGAYGSVGIAGGFSQGGGHGPMQPKYGLAADTVLEYDVILANGSALTINACQHADLFWAMRGGGGGTYAVVTSMTSRIYPTLPLHFVQAMIQLSDPLGSDARAAMKDMVVILGTEQPRLSKAGLAGYNFLGETSLMTAQIVADAEPGIMNRTFGSFVDRIRNDTRYNITMLEYATFPNWTAISPVVVELGEQTPVGLGKRLASRFVPKSFFESSTSLRPAVDAIFEGFDTYLATNPHDPDSPLIVQLWSTGPANHPDGSDVGAHPAWRDELWEVIYVGSFYQHDSDQTKSSIANGIHKAVDPLRSLTPGGGTYMNEADVLEEDWQGAFFGDNYPKLLKIKEKYDPTGVFTCWKCVGWSSDHTPASECYKTV